MQIITSFAWFMHIIIFPACCIMYQVHIWQMIWICLQILGKIIWHHFKVMIIWILMILNYDIEIMSSILDTRTQSTMKSAQYNGRQDPATHVKWGVPNSGHTSLPETETNYRQFSNIRRTQSQNINVSRLVLQLFLPNPLKPGVKLRMKM